MLLGRDRERAELEAALATARGGQSALLALRGEPGIGKSTLLDHAARCASGMQLLRARAIESESRVPFAGLLDLVRPVLGHLDRIPAPQAQALAGALALAPASAGDRFAIGAATLSLLAVAAEDRPLAVIFDDVQWLDGASAGALLFALRRLVADPVAVLLAVRSGESSLLDGAGVPVLALEGLDPESTADLLSRETGAPVADDLRARVHGSTRGNPLAVIELAPEAGTLSWDPVEAPLPVSESLSRSFLRRAGSLGRGARAVLLLAAATERGDLAVIGRAAASRGLDVAELAGAERAGLVAIRAGAVEFRHPLVRSAVYTAASPEERREAHRALAGALPDRDVDRRAWHLAAATVGTDDGVCAALEQAGARARERSAYTVATTAFERAGRLAPDEARRARLLRSAADAAWLAGLAERASVLLVQALEYADDPALVVGIEHLRGHIAVRRGHPREGHAILVAAADAAAARDPERAAVMLAEASNAAFYCGDAAAMLRAATRAHALVARGAGDEALFFATLAHGMALVFGGEGEQGTRAIRRAIDLLEGPQELRPEPHLLAWAVMGPLWLREADAGRTLATRALDSARRNAAIGVLPFLLMHIGRDHAGCDRWSEAAAVYHEGIGLARETAQRTDLAALLAALAALEARRGDDEQCRAHAAEARSLAASIGPGIHELWALAALGDLELGRGDAGAAIAHLEALDGLLGSLGVADADLSPAPELVEAYLRVGRRDDAAATAATFAPRALAKGQPWALARAARCRGMLAAERGFEDEFAAALALHERTPDAFAAARTRLAYGARLRRSRRRVRAREQLRAALQAFDDLGAAPWAELARSELAATGETARRRDPSTRDDLTPQELQISLLLASGRTTREAAAALFLSPKTIEYHLGHVYRKLGIGSRAELADKLADATGAGAAGRATDRPPAGAGADAGGGGRREPPGR